MGFLFESRTLHLSIYVIYIYIKEEGKDAGKKQPKTKKGNLETWKVQDMSYHPYPITTIIHGT